MLKITNTGEVKDRLSRGITKDVSTLISNKADSMQGLTLRQVFLYIEETSSLLLPYSENTEMKNLISSAKRAVKKFTKAMDKGYHLNEEDIKSISVYYCLNRYFLEGDV